MLQIASEYVKYLVVIFDKLTAWRLDTKMIEAKAFRTFITVYSLFKSEQFSSDIKLFLHKALIISLTNYVCPA
jgi:hypothetical protein